MKSLKSVPYELFDVICWSSLLLGIFMIKWWGFKKKKMGFTPCNTEKPLRGMELWQKETQKILKHTGNLLKKNPQLQGVC